MIDMWLVGYKDAYAATDQKASTEFKAGSRERVRSDGIWDGVILCLVG